MSDHGFGSLDIKPIFHTYPAPVRRRLLHLRQLIFTVASDTTGVGELVETLKWGQPSYLTQKPKSGTTVRIDAVGDGAHSYAMYVPCSTTLVATWRELYADALKFEGNRAVVFSLKDELPEDAVKHCIAMALTYHGRVRAA